MQYLTLMRDDGADDLKPLDEPTVKDIIIIDEALADADRRHLAEVALALAAQIVMEAEDDEETEEEARDLSATEREALSRLGISATLPMSDRVFRMTRPVVEGMKRRARMTVTAIPLAQAAERMGVTDGRLRQRISEGTLVAIPRPHGRGWLIPAFQLTEDGELPYLSRVLGAARRTLSPESLDSFFELPQEELEGLSPRDWLIGGGDPAPLINLVSDL